MNFIDIKNLNRKEKIAANELDKVRKNYDLIDLNKYYEPKLLSEIDDTKQTDKMTLIITEPSDINCWISYMGQSCLVKMRMLEDSIACLLDRRDLYSAAIISRHHMELAGLLCLSLEVLKDALKEQNVEKLQRFISRTFYGSSYFNNPNLRDSEHAFFRTETPSVSAMMKALDNFLEINSQGKAQKNLFKHNYAFFCQFAHPSADSSSYFIDSEEFKDGHFVQFKWTPIYDKSEIYITLKSLKQNTQFGLSCYYLLSAHYFHNNGYVMNEEYVQKSYEILTERKVDI